MCENTENNLTPEETAAEAVPSAESELETLKAALEAEKDARLRLAAEYDNFRRRSLKEKEALAGDATAAAVAEFLPVIDNLERAVAASGDSAEGILEGLTLIMKQLSATAEKLGLTAIDPKGESFDPNLHNAVMHEEVEDVEPNTVTEVFQKGYRIGERVVRYAMVKVAN